MNKTTTLTDAFTTIESRTDWECFRNAVTSSLSHEI